MENEDKIMRKNNSDSKKVTEESKLDKLESLKDSLKNSETVSEIYNNPAVQFIIGNLNIVPGGIKDVIDAGITQALQMFQEKKRTKLFEIIFGDYSIQTKDVSDVKVIFEFAKLLNVVNHLAKADKIQYLGELMKNSIPDIRKGYIDEFEEGLGKLEMLSDREIILIEELYQCEQECVVKNHNPQIKNFNHYKSWEVFQKKCHEKYDMKKTDISSMMCSIMRSGFCMIEWTTGLDNAGTMMCYTTPEYHKFRNKILSV